MASKQCYNQVQFLHINLDNYNLQSSPLKRSLKIFQSESTPYIQIELKRLSQDPIYDNYGSRLQGITTNDDSTRFSLSHFTPKEFGPNIISLLPSSTLGTKIKSDNGYDKPLKQLFLIIFSLPEELRQFLNACKAHKNSSHLLEMDPNTIQPYFHYYGKLSNQMNMLQDSVRTSSYKRAITENTSDFYGRTVLDVGAGSGILSYFALEAGAKKVFSVEPSSVCASLKLISESNPHLKGRIFAIPKIIEELSDNEIGSKVDVLISEPIGTFLFNERMIETYLYARDHFLKPEGKMYPNKCTLALAPFSDHILYNELINKAKFWDQTNFYGINLTSAYKNAINEQFFQPVVDYIDPSTIIATPHFEPFNLQTIDKSSLEHIHFTFEFQIEQPNLVHGMAGWFDVSFDGTDQKIGFSTSPWSAPTHWYQIRFLFSTPLAVNASQILKGFISMKANDKQSYFIDLRCEIDGTPYFSECQNIDLKDPDYRYCSSANTYIPQHSYIYSSTPLYSSDTNSYSNLYYDYSAYTNQNNNYVRTYPHKNQPPQG